MKIFVANLLVKQIIYVLVVKDWLQVDIILGNLSSWDCKLSALDILQADLMEGPVLPSMINFMGNCPIGWVQKQYRDGKVDLNQPISWFWNILSRGTCPTSQTYFHTSSIAREAHASCTQSTFCRPGPQLSRSQAVLTGHTLMKLLRIPGLLAAIKSLLL